MWTDGRTDGWIDVWTDGWTDVWTDRWTDVWTDGWTNTRTDRRMDGLMDGWTKRPSRSLYLSEYDLNEPIFQTNSTLYKDTKGGGVFPDGKPL